MRPFFLAVGSLFLVVAFQRTWEGVLSWRAGPTELAVAMVLVTTGLLAAGFGWLALLEGKGSRGPLLAAYFEAQLGKYLPGGFWQPVAQARLSKGSGVGTTDLFTRVPVHIVTQLAAGCFFGGLLVLVPGVPSRLRWVAASALVLGIFILFRRWFHLVALLVRRIRRDRTAPSIPAQKALIASASWAMGTLALSGSAFSLLLGSTDSPWSFTQTTLAFSLAWSCGFVAFPFPAGIGVREGVLALATGLPPAVVIQASLVHRLVTIGAEAGAALFARLRVR